MSRLILAVLLMVIVGCSGRNDTQVERFIVTSTQKTTVGRFGRIYILCDTLTGEEYAIFDGDRRAGITSLGTTCPPYVRLLSR